jgi:hypothetical protein
MLTILSHYFPALYFAIIAVCQIYDFLFNRFVSLGLPQRPVIGGTVAVVYLALSIVAFTLYSPLAYGNMWTQADCKRVKLFDTWDWDCDNFLTSVSNVHASNSGKPNPFCSSMTNMHPPHHRLSIPLFQHLPRLRS